eukprot:Rhum_TRINITY_DN15192_c1_g1::Rhum_TRINITY_DN15192_c1_g1_i4::g.143452::m.143452
MPECVEVLHTRLRVAAVHHTPVRQEQQVRERAEHHGRRLVDRHDHGPASLRKFTKRVRHSLSRERVESRRRLVEQQDVRVGHEHEPDRNTLSLAAGQAATADGVGAHHRVRHLLQTQLIDDSLHALRAGRVRGGLRQLQLGGEHQRLPDRLGRHQLVVLHHVAEAPLHRSLLGRHAVDLDGAGGGHEAVGDGVEQRRLAGACGAHDGGKGAGGEDEADVVEEAARLLLARLVVDLDVEAEVLDGDRLRLAGAPLEGDVRGVRLRFDVLVDRLVAVVGWRHCWAAVCVYLALISSNEVQIL